VIRSTALQECKVQNEILDNLPPAHPVPMMYDIRIDEMRPVTQEDVDRLLLVQQCYGELRKLLRNIAAFPPLGQAINLDGELARIRAADHAAARLSSETLDVLR
jgi:hypothetical protein